MNKIYQKAFSGGKTAGFTLIELLINERHSRGMLSGIFRFYSCCLGLVNGQKTGDPRQKHSGMTALKPLRMTTPLDKRKRALLGFTLIELLVVVLIIGILAAVALPQYRRAVVKARTASVLPLLRSLADAEERFYMANGYYATEIEELDVNWPDKYLPSGNGAKWEIGDDGIVAAYNYTVDIPPLGYYFRYSNTASHKPGKFYCNGYDSDIKAWVCRSLGEPVYEWTPWFTYW